MYLWRNPNASAVESLCIADETAAYSSVGQSSSVGLYTIWVISNPMLHELSPFKQTEKKRRRRESMLFPARVQWETPFHSPTYRSQAALQMDHTSAQAMGRVIHCTRREQAWLQGAGYTQTALYFEPLPPLAHWSAQHLPAIAQTNAVIQEWPCQHALHENGNTCPCMMPAVLCGQVCWVCSLYGEWGLPGALIYIGSQIEAFLSLGHLTK